MILFEQPFASACLAFRIPLLVKYKISSYSIFRKGKEKGLELDSTADQTKPEQLVFYSNHGIRTTVNVPIQITRHCHGQLIVYYLSKRKLYHVSGVKISVNSTFSRECRTVYLAQPY